MPKCSNFKFSTHSTHAAPLFAIALTVSMSVFASISPSGTTARVMVPWLQVPAEDAVRSAAGAHEERQALRLQARLQRNGMEVSSIDSLKNALMERKHLLSLSVTAVFTAVDESDVLPQSKQMDVAGHPEWIVYKSSKSNPSFVLSQDTIQYSLTTYDFEDVPMPVDVVTSEPFEDRDGNLRVSFDRMAESGYAFDAEVVAENIYLGLMEGYGQILWPVDQTPGTVTVTDADSTYSLSLIASGLSDYKGSSSARKHNIHVGIDQQLNGIVVPQGETFSFNDSMGPIASSRGWVEWLGIIKGKLEPAMGAGVCQVSTTTFRGALLAGLPVPNYRNHSMFLDYYVKYGVGLDSTIFPGHQDLTFVNDTPGPIVIQAYVSGLDVVVNLYGVDDGRETVMEGPYFKENVGDRLVAFGRDGLAPGHVAWVRKVTRADGTVNEEMILSRYSTAVWKSVVAKYSGNEDSLNELRASAPTPQL